MITEAHAAFTALPDLNFIGSFMENLIYFKALHQLANACEVGKGEKTAIIRIKKLEAAINFCFAHVSTEPFSALPKIILVNTTGL